MRQDEMYDHALAAALLCVETVQTSPGAAQYEIVSMFTFIILEAMKCYEAEAVRSIVPSNN